MRNQIHPIRRSKRLATIIPASYWMSIGYPECIAQYVENLQHDMKEYCDSSESNIRLRSRDNDSNDVGRILPFHELMLPHWEIFASALDKRRNVEIIDFCGIQLPLSVLERVLPSIQKICLKKLYLLQADLGPSEFMYLSSFLRENSSLLDLSIVSGGIDLDAARSFSDALRNHPSLEDLKLWECDLGNAAKLEIILDGCKRLETLYLDANRLGSAGVALIADFIGNNYAAKYICLRDNQICDGDVPNLASALRRNTTLVRIDLRINRITCEGRKEMMKAMHDTKNMNSIVQSNHSCLIHMYDDDGDGGIVIPVDSPVPNEFELVCINFGMDAIGKKVRKKVVLALCGNTGNLFDLQYFNGIPLKLMPRSLELIQEHTRRRTEDVSEGELDREALSRLFHTLRGWEMPLLFENLQCSMKVTRRGKRKRNISQV